MSEMAIEDGQSYEVQCPFVLERVSFVEEDGPSIELSWRPGVKWEPGGPFDSVAVAHGMGAVTYTVVGQFHPKPFPARVFFTRKFRPAACCCAFSTGSTREVQ